MTLLQWAGVGSQTTEVNQNGESPPDLPYVHFQTKYIFHVLQYTSHKICKVKLLSSCQNCIGLCSFTFFSPLFPQGGQSCFSLFPFNGKDCVSCTKYIQNRLKIQDHDICCGQNVNKNCRQLLKPNLQFDHRNSVFPFCFWNK